MSAPNVFYVLKLGSDYAKENTGYGPPGVSLTRNLKDVIRFPSISAVLERLNRRAATIGAGFLHNYTYSIVRVTEVPGTTKREVIPEGQAYDPKTVQYAISLDEPGLFFRDDVCGNRVGNPLAQAALYPSHNDAIRALYHDAIRNKSLMVDTIRIVPVRITTTPSSFTEEVVQ